MRFAWVLIFINTIALAKEEDLTNEIHLIHRNINTSATEQATEKKHATPQHNFFNNPTKYAAKTFSTIFRYSFHLIPLTMGIKCLHSKDRQLTYKLMQICFSTWLSYYFKFWKSPDDNYEDESPFIQSTYSKTFAYSGLSYITCFPYFTHVGALHIAFDASKNIYKSWTAPEISKNFQK